MQPMPRKLPLHVRREKTRHGRIVFYFRKADGPRIRMPAPNDPDFARAYAAAMAGSKVRTAPTSDPRSLRWLIDRYRESAKWRGLSAATRKQREAIFRQVIDKSGNRPFSAVDRASIQGGIDARSGTPAQAVSFLKAMRGLFGWAVRNGHMPADPTIGADRPAYRPAGFPAWTRDDVAAFRAVHPEGSRARLVMEFALLTGLRRSDMIRIGRQHLRNGILSIATAKTGMPVTIALPAPLIDLIGRTPTGDLHFIVSETGQPFTVESLGNWFRDRCRDAGVMKSLHGLRKLSATMAAEGGAAAHELMAQFGWTNIKEAERYTKTADRARLGVRASQIVAEQIANALPPHLSSGAAFNAKKPAKSKVKN